VDREKDAEAGKAAFPLTRADVEQLLSSVKRPSQLDLSLQNLRGIDLSYLDLQGANLQGADLQGANLRGTNFREANLQAANLSEADLDGADLSRAKLGENEATRANLHGANLCYATLRDLDLRGFNLAGLDLRNVDLNGTDLRGAVLQGANLQGADLSSAHLHGPELHGAILHSGVFATTRRRERNIQQWQMPARTSSIDEYLLSPQAEQGKRSTSLTTLDHPPIINHMVNNSSERLDTVFLALSDPTRRAILERLMQGEASGTELARPFSISVPAISRHLRVLKEADLILHRKDGRTHWFRLAPSPMKEAATWLEQYRKFWEEQFDSLQAYLQTTAEEEQDADDASNTP